MLCRACGSEMAASEFCPSCNEAVVWRCPACQKENDRSIHTYHNGIDQPVGSAKTGGSLLGVAVGVVSGLYTLVPM